MKRLAKKVVPAFMVVVALCALFAITVSAGVTPYKMDGRWCQDYTITVSNANWKYTTSTGTYPGVQKLFSARPFVVQVNSNTLTSYQTAFAAAIAYSDVGFCTNNAWVSGKGSNTATYLFQPYSSERLCLGSRSDTRATGTYTNSGIWSPDRAY